MGQAGQGTTDGCELNLKVPTRFKPTWKEGGTH